MVKECLKNFFETIKSLNDKIDKPQANYIREIAEKNKERSEERRRKKEESDYKENCKIIENIVYQEIKEAAREGEFFVEICMPTLRNSVVLFDILKNDYKEHFETRGYTFKFEEFSEIEIVRISW